MSKLRIFNEQLMKQYLALPHKEDFSYPLFVSSNPIYLENISLAKPKVLYIGQETNCWINNQNSPAINCDLLEETYFNFLNVRHCTNRDFWNFLYHILDVKREEIGKKVIWSNTLIAGRKQSMGPPQHKEELYDMSIQNLLFLSEYFQPDITLFVSGPSWNYYPVMTEFLQKKHSCLQGKYPTKTNPLLEDKENTILWTYHPAYLHRLGIKESLEQQIQKKYIKSF